MPILFAIIGIVLVISGVRNRVTNGNPSLMSLLKQDFSGSDPFWKWALAIIFIGAIGYVPSLSKISRGFLVLVILVILLKNNGGVFSKLESVFGGENSQQNNASENLQLTSLPEIV